MYAKNENGIITIYSSLPNKYVSETINCAGGFHLLDEATHKAEGFYPVVAVEYDPDAERLGPMYFDEVNEFFTYNIEDIPALEIARRGWHHQEYSKRIVAPSSLIDEYPNIAIWMQLNQLPIVLSEDTLVCYLYMNTVRAQHQALVDSLQGMLTIENIPT
jgi:hypothetical protein